MQDAKRASDAIGLKSVQETAVSVIANTPRVTAIIICTTLPKAGPCPGQDGAVASMIVTAAPGPDAPTTLDKMVKAFGNVGVIDCG